MIYRKYYNPFEAEVVVPKPVEPAVHKEHIHHKKRRKMKIRKKEHSNAPLSFLSRLKFDDLIIVGILLLLVFEEQDERDLPLILSLGFLLISEFTDLF